MRLYIFIFEKVWLPLRCQHQMGYSICNSRIRSFTVHTTEDCAIWTAYKAVVAGATHYLSGDISVKWSHILKWIVSVGQSIQSIPFSTVVHCNVPGTSLASLHEWPFRMIIQYIIDRYDIDRLLIHSLRDKIGGGNEAMIGRQWLARCLHFRPMCDVCCMATTRVQKFSDRGHPSDVQALLESQSGHVSII